MEQEDVAQKLNEIGISSIETLQKWIDTGSSFVAEQAPLFIQEYLTWEFTEATIFAVIFFLLSIATGKSTHWWFKRDKDWHTAFPIILMFMSVFCAIATIGYTRHAIKVKVAPRVVLMEKVKELSTIGQKRLR